MGKQCKVVYGGFFKPRGEGVALPLSAVLDGTSGEVLWWEEGGHSHPPHQPGRVSGHGAGPWPAASPGRAGARAACGDDR